MKWILDIENNFNCLLYDRFDEGVLINIFEISNIGLTTARSNLAQSSENTL